MTEKEPRVRRHRIILLLSYAALLCVAMQAHKANATFAAILFVVGAALLLFLPGQRVRIPAVRRPTWIQIAVIVLFCVGFFFQFRRNWLFVTQLKPLIARFGGWWPVLINGLGALGAAAIPPILWKLLEEARRLLGRIGAAAAAGESAVGKISLRWIRGGLGLAILFLQLVILQTGGGVSFPQNLYMLKVSAYFINLGLLLIVSLTLVIFLQRWRLAMLVSSALFSLWGVANHYVMLFHGSPLMLSEFANAGAAMNVLSDYRVTLPEIPWLLLALVLLLIPLVRTFWIADRQPRPFRWSVLAARVGVLAALTAAAWTILLRPGANNVISWSYARSVSKSGFLTCVVQDEDHRLHPILCPPGYDAGRLPEPEIVSDDPAAVHPDVILILNETFCDLDDYTPIRADSDYLAPFYETPNAAFGRAVSPSIGGGTNNAEFELLTAGSYYLMQSTSPFTYLDFTKINCTAVEYLERLGYTTCGIHLRGRTNYNRHVAYPAIGFDQVWLGGMDLGDRYGNRSGLDSVYYDFLIRQYEACPDDAPRFMYILTYQNHGGYDQNDASFDTVHTGSDLGDVTQPVNEFLTSMSMSAEAFRDLIAYLSDVDRPVILCMVGDHAPSIIGQILSEKERDDLQTQFAQRVIPYVVWSNFGADLSDCPEYTNTFGLVPLVLRAAGLPLTDYYQAVLKMKEEYPVFISNGVYMDANGTLGIYDPDDSAFRSITEYLYLEYNAMAAGDDYREALFLPQ